MKNYGRKLFPAFVIVLLLTMVCFTLWTCKGEADVNQRRIEKDRAKKQKQAMKEYEKAVKHHKDIQSKSTKSSMKRTKKEAAKLTPVEH